MRIFLSHQSCHKPLVREFKNHLPPFLSPWLDEERLVWGDSLSAELLSTIQSSVDFLIIFLDDNALSSKWVAQELDWAFRREVELGRRFVLPVILGSVAPQSLPPGFSNRLQLNLPDFGRASVETLAKQASHQLFQLVVKSFSTLESGMFGQESRPLRIEFFQGDWHECHATFRAGKPCLVREEWHIQDYWVESKADTGLKYSGTIGQDDCSIIINFKGEHGELVTCRLYRPIPSNDLVILGMWFAVDYDMNIACGPALVSESPLDESVARQLMRDRIESSDDLPLMKLRR